MADKSPTDLDRGLQELANRDTELRASARESILNALTPSLVPVGHISSQRILITQILAVFAFCGLVIVFLTGWAGLQFVTHTQIFAMATIVIAGAIALAIGLAAEMVPAVKTVPPLTILLPLTLALVTCVSLLFPWQASKAFVAEGVPCMLLEIFVAVPAAGLFLFVAHRGAPFFNSRFGVILSGLSVLLALAVVQTHCMFPTAEHLLIWHVGIAALLVGFGAIAPRLR
jgi:hypothetical protein